MSVRWERLAGDTSSFALKFAFHRDPDEGEAATPEMAASWGAFQIWVGGKNLCAHVDQGETLEYAHWYLLPLLEWLSANWDPLLHEERLPRFTRTFGTASDMPEAAASTARFGNDADQLLDFDKQYEWRQRHALRTSRDGGIFPEVHFRRYRDQIEISWAAAGLAGVENVEFLAAEGTEHIDPIAVAEPLHEVLESAAEWLHRRLPTSERLNGLVESIRGLNTLERTEERTAWLAGLGNTRDRMAERWRTIRASCEELRHKYAPDAFDAVFGSEHTTGLVLGGSCEAALLFGSASPTITDQDAVVLADVLLRAYDPSPVDGLSDLVWDEPAHVRRVPWEHGYELAEDLLDEVGDDLDGLHVDIEAFLEHRNVQVNEIDLEDKRLRAVSFVSNKHAPSIVLNSRHWSTQREQARRFTLAHELCHLLHDRSHGARLAIASGPWAPLAVEQRANAFAAWLLMPPDRLQRAIARATSPIDTRAGVAAVAHELNVSRVALVEHLGNLDFISEEQRTELLLSN